MGDHAFWRRRDDGVAVAVKVTPRARRPGLGGVVADGGADGEAQLAHRLASL